MKNISDSKIGHLYKRRALKSTSDFRYNLAPVAKLTEKDYKVDFRAYLYYHISKNDILLKIDEDCILVKHHSNKPVTVFYSTEHNKMFSHVAFDVYFEEIK